MKRFWFSLLSLGLVFAFSSPAFAVDVKFSGSFYAAGMYLDRTTFAKNTATDGPSTAFYFQRLRVQTDFVVSPGLTLITRFDALERAWGAPRSTPGTALDSQSAGTTAENENIAVDWVYLQYASPIGSFRVGYMNDGAWGTVFMDTSVPRGKIAWSNTTGPWFYTLQIVKLNDYSYTAKNNLITTTDADVDKYVAAVRYSWSGGEAGILGGIGRDARTKPTANFYTFFYTLQPYATAQIGPVKIQAEIDYFWGDWKKFDSGSGNVKMENLAAFLDATADFGMIYAGGTFAYVSGDDPTTLDKAEGNSLLVSGGLDWNPCLILFNNDRTYWGGAIPGYDGTQNPNLNEFAPGTAPGMTNAWFLQGRVGVRPVAPLDIMASVSWATADKKFIPGTTTAVPNGTYGTEVDLTATYKITNNLTYMLGVGYLFTGDYFKGVTVGANVRDDYLVINKLTLTF